MVLAVTSSTGTTPSSGAASTAVLQAQLARCQLQLNDWFHCPSSKTPEGKAKVDALTSQVDSLKAQLQQASLQSRPSSRTAPVPLTSTTPSTAATGQGSGNAAATLSASGMLGSQVNVFV